MPYITITPKDPIIARDGRPFGFNSNRMKSLDWFYPSVVAGTVRTVLGRQLGYNFKEEESLQKLKDISVHGPLPLLNNTLYLPAPLDCVAKSEKEYFIARPYAVSDGEDTDMPNGLSPVLLDTEDDYFKPYKIPAFWSLYTITNWLKEPSKLQNLDFDSKNNFIDFPQKEVRTHVKIKNGVAEDEKLFQTTALDFMIKKNNSFDLLQMSAFVSDGSIKKTVATMGGERRIVGIDINSLQNWDCPNEITQSLTGAKKNIRMVLATPAIFNNGWLPSWLNENFEGSLNNVKLKLKSAVVERWQPVSGWSYETNGPKAVRRMVPAGSVYFFEVLEGNASDLSSLWLKPVSDDKQDCKDGFGLAIFGIY